MAKLLLHEATREHLNDLPKVNPANWQAIRYGDKLKDSMRLLLKTCRRLREARIAAGLCRALMEQALKEPECVAVDEDGQTTTAIPTLDFKITGVSIAWSSTRFDSRCRLRTNIATIAYWLEIYERQIDALLDELRRRRERLERDCEEQITVRATAFIFAPEYAADFSLWCTIAGWDAHYVRDQIKRREMERGHRERGDQIRARLGVG